jgi:hypothetical protein
MDQLHLRTLVICNRCWQVGNQGTNHQSNRRTDLQQNKQQREQGEEERRVTICGSFLPIKRWRCDPECARSLLHWYRKTLRLQSILV